MMSTRSSASKGSQITGSKKNIEEKEEMSSNSPLVSLPGGQRPGAWLSPPTTSGPVSQRSSQGSLWGRLSSDSLSIGVLHGVAGGPVRSSRGINLKEHYSYQPGNLEAQARLLRTTLYASATFGLGTTTNPLETADPCQNGPTTGENPLQMGELTRDWTAQTSALDVQSLGISKHQTRNPIEEYSSHSS